MNCYFERYKFVWIISIKEEYLESYNCMQIICIRKEHWVLYNSVKKKKRIMVK